MGYDRLAAVLLAAGLSGAWADALVPETPERPVVVPIVFADGLGLTPSARDAMRQAVCALLEPWGILVEWIEPGEGGGRPDLLKVVLHRGDPPAIWKLPKRTLGTIFGRQRPAEGVYLFATPIRRELEPPARRGAGVSDSETGRAIGRVLVHELVHAFLPDRPHTRSGLMSAGLDRRTLLAPDTTLDRGSATALAAAARERLNL